MAYPDPINSAHRLEDGASVISSTRNGLVNSLPRVFDAGVDTWFGFLIFDVSAIDTANGDETYQITIQVSNTSDFSEGVLNLNTVSVLATGQQAVLLNTNVNGQIYRYMRLRFTPAGTSPSITLSAWLINRDDLSDLSLAGLTRVMGVAVSRFSEMSNQFRNWSSGSEDGGPNGDGKYPLQDGAGSVFLVDCPAKIAANAAQGLSTAGALALSIHTTPLASPTDPMPHVMGVVNPGTAGQALRRFPLDLFASRKTSDLQEIPTMLGTELIPAINASTGVEGKIAFNEIYRRTFGCINPSLPPYNCQFDAVFHRHTIASTAGSNIIECLDEPIFERAKVGHIIQLSNAGPSFTALKGTITELIDDYRVRISSNASSTHGSQDCLFGTDDTAGMQAALDDCGALSTYTYGKVLLLPPGMALVGHLRYPARCGIFGRGIRQTSFLRLDDGARSVPIWGYYSDDDGDGLFNEEDPDYPNSDWAFQLEAKNRHCDFNAIGDLSLIGARYCQSNGYGGFSAKLQTGAYPMAQTDPYPFYSRIHVQGQAWHGWEHGGRHSGSMIGVEIIDCGGMGYYLQGYDANITNILAIGCTGPGVFIEESQGANNNLLNVKVSFNGTGELGYFLGQEAATSNMVVSGTGNNITNVRCQESYGSNLYVSGKRNQFGDVGLDDTGNIAYKDGGNAYLISNLPPVRAAILLGSNADDNRFNDVGFGPAVNPTNYATNGVFHYDSNNDGGAQRASGRIFSKNVSSYWSADTPAVPGPIGAVNQAPHSSCYYTVDDQSIASLYP